MKIFNILCGYAPAIVMGMWAIVRGIGIHSDLLAAAFLLLTACSLGFHIYHENERWKRVRGRT